MKNSLLALLFLGLTANFTYGNTYQVTMTCAVTSSNDPLLSVGNVFTSVFQYHSDSIDGTFYSFNSGPGPGFHLQNPHDTKSELFGGILTPDGGFSATSYSYRDISYIHDNYSMNNQITVTNGVVSDFYVEEYEAEGSAGYTENDFNFWSEPYLVPFPPVPYRVKGTVGFDTPKLVPENVATVGLLGFALIALAAFRRRSILS